MSIINLLAMTIVGALAVFSTAMLITSLLHTNWMLP
jgi:hypothetical protein